MNLIDQSRVTPGRVLVAMIAGVLTCTAITAIAGWILQGKAGTADPGGPLSFLVPYVIISAAGITLAAPIWFVLHRLGRRGWYDAALVGVAVPILGSLICIALVLTLFKSSSFFDLGGLAIDNGKITRHGWTEASRACSAMSLIGCATAMLMWRIAYPRSHS